MGKTIPRIVAIGGGQMHKLATLSIDRYIVGLTGRKRPRALFIPTASGDSEPYVETFHKVYGKKLGCRTSALELFRSRPSRAEMRRMVFASDLIYVGGGNTYRMMKLWRRIGLDRVLRTTAKRGIVLAGLSAGAICWFRHGHSDSRRRPGQKRWKAIRVSGLGLVAALFCPHYHAEHRERSLRRMVARHGGVTIACDNHAALDIAGDAWRVLTSRRSGKAYRLLRRRGKVFAESLPADGTYRPLADLLASRPVTPKGR